MDYNDAFNVRKNNLSKGIFAYYKEHVMIHKGYKQWVKTKFLFNKNNKKFYYIKKNIVMGRK